MAHVLKAHWSLVESYPHINAWQLRTLGALMRCRTSALGGHMDACSSCGSIRVSYNSCRNRHCPKCQGKNREQWISKRESELLPVPYFHVVFTLPDLLNELAMHQPAQVYNTLFEAAWSTLKTFGNDPKHLGANTGMICILHTWGQTMTLHPHLHCVVPGGGLTKSGNWKKAKSKGKYLFPVKAMSKVYRAKYIEALKVKIPSLDKKLINNLFKKDWVVYAKRPFSHAGSVIEYLGRYTHKVAISNHRIESIENGNVNFEYKDYRHGATKKMMLLDGIEFIRRFSMHILPKGFTRIRHYGILSSTSKLKTIVKIREQLPAVYLPEKTSIAITYDPLLCTCCNTQTMVTIEVWLRGPPIWNPNREIKA